jgi:hypothetical protein
MFRRLPVELQRIAAAARGRLHAAPSSPPIPPRTGGFFYVVVWRPGFALGAWRPFEDATGRIRSYRTRANAERAGLEVRSSFDGIVAVQEGTSATWSRCKRFRRPRAL